jgi:hypothetical protein
MRSMAALALMIFSLTRPLLIVRKDYQAAE